jgi:hypothetical protein
LDDLVRGRVEFDWAREQDHVVQRADGSCLYHLASVVDDRDLEITHVIRSEEHLSNTPRQVFIAQSLGYQLLPSWAFSPCGSTSRKPRPRHDEGGNDSGDVARPGAGVHEPSDDETKVPEPWLLRLNAVDAEQNYPCVCFQESASTVCASA